MIYTFIIMSQWGSDADANKLKKSYIKGFLDVSGGNLVAQNSSTIMIMSAATNIPALQIKTDRFSVNTGTSIVDISYSTFGALGSLGVSYEQSTAELIQRTKYLTTGTNVSLFGNSVVPSDLQVYGNIFAYNAAANYGFSVTNTGSMYLAGDVSMSGALRVGGDISLNGRFTGFGDISLNGNIRTSGNVNIGNVLSVANDTSLNGNLFVLRDISLNGNARIGSRLSVNGDVSLNANTRLTTVAINKDISAGFALDVSGITNLRGPLLTQTDVSVNGAVLVGTDVSINRSLYVVNRALFSGDVSMNRNLDIGTGSNSVAINKDISSGFALDVSGITNMRGPFYTLADVSLGQKLFVQSDASVNGSVLVGTDVSINRSLYVVNRALFSGDVSLNRNTRLGTGGNSVAINKDISAGFALDVSGITNMRGPFYSLADVSLGQKLFVQSDASVNGSVLVGTDVSINRSLYVVNRALFSGDVSLNRNTRLGTGGNSVAINKDISSGFALDISGITNMRGPLYALADVSLGQRLFVQSDASVNGSVLVGTDVSINRSLYVVNRALFSGDVSLNKNSMLGSGSNVIAINKDVSAGFHMDISGNLRVSNASTFHNKVTIGMPSAANIYELDLSGQMRIFEPVGTTATASQGSLTFEHGDASGTSSIVFKSKNNVNSDYAYIQYQENDGGTSEKGLFTIGIENDATSSNQRDRISLYSAGGSGYVGVNTKDPLYHFDVSGTTNMSGKLIVAGDVSINNYISSYGFNTSNRQPPSALTSNVTNIIGHGQYTAYTSSAPSGGSAYLAFDYSTITGLSTPYGYNSIIGDPSINVWNYSDSILVNGVAFPGYRTHIDLPYETNVTSFRVVVNLSSRSPVQASLIGSNDGLSWYEIYSYDLSATINNSTPSTTGTYDFSFANAAYYSKYAYIVKSITSATRFSLVEIYLYGNATLNTQTVGAVSISTSNSLSVGTNANIYGNLDVYNDVSINGNTKLGIGNNSVAINKDISAGFALDISGITNMRGPLYALADVSLGQRLFVGGDASVNGSIAVGTDLSVNRNVYVGGNIVMNGNINASSNVTLNQLRVTNDTSLNGNLVIGTGSNMVSINKDISAGIHLDISGNLRVSDTIFANNVLTPNVTDTLNIATTQTTGSINIGTSSAKTGAINIGNPNNQNFIGNFCISGNHIRGNASQGLTVFTSFNATANLRIAENMTGGTHQYSFNQTSGSIQMGGSNKSSGSIEIGCGNNSALHTVRISNGASNAGNLQVFDGSNSTGTATFGRDNAIRIVNGPVTTVDISSAGIITVRGSAINMIGDLSLNGKLAVGNDVSLNGRLNFNGTAGIIANSDNSQTMTFASGTTVGTINIGSDQTSGALNIATASNRSGNVNVLTGTSNTGILIVGGDVSLNRNLFVGGDTSLNGNFKIGTGSNLVAINKDVSTGFHLDISGITRSTQLVTNTITAVDPNANINLFGDSATAGSINIGMGARSAGASVNINNNASSSAGTNIGGGSISIAGSGNMTLQSAASNTVNIASNQTTGIINIANASRSNNGTASTGSINIGTGSATGVAGGVSEASGCVINIGTGTRTNNSTINIGTGTRDSTSIINIGSSASASAPIYVNGLRIRNTGTLNAVELSSTNFLTLQSSVSSDINIGNNLTSGDINIGTGTSRTSAGLINIGTGADVSGDINIGTGDRNYGDVNILTGANPTGRLIVGGDVSLNTKLSVGGDVSLNSRLTVVNDASLNSNLTVLGNAFLNRIIVTSDTSLNGNLAVSGDISSNQNMYIAGKATLGRPPATGTYELDISGQTRIYELVGSNVVNSSSVATLTLEHGDASGCSSIMFTSPSTLSNGDYAYIKYQDLSGTTTNAGLLTIGIENDPSAVNVADKISLLAAGGSGFVGVNTVNPAFSLDISGNTNVSGTLITNFIDSSNVSSVLAIGNTITTGNINIGTASGNKRITIGATNLGTTLLYGSPVMVNSGTNGTVLIGNAVTTGTVTLGNSLTSGTLHIGNAMTSGTINFGPVTTSASSTTVNFATGSSYTGTINIGTGAGTKTMLVGGAGTTIQMYGIDISFAGNAKIGSGNRFVAINKDISAGLALDVSGQTNLRGRLFALADASFGSNLFVNGDVSANGNATIGNRFVVVGDSSLNSKLIVGGDVSFNSRLYVNGDVSANGNASMNGSVFVNGDISANGNLRVQKSIAINKDISSQYVLDVNGLSQFRGSVDVGGSLTINGMPVNASSLSGNVQVGSNNGYVTVNKPQFFADPSLLIYYNFDTSINNGTQVQNIANPGTFDGSLNANGGSPVGTIDTSIRKYGTASFKSNPVTNQGVSILNSPLTISSIISFSLWVYITVTPTPRYRLFEYTDHTLFAQSTDNNTIALEVSGNGIVYPVLTNGATTCIATLTSPIVSYNLINSGWNHITWVISPTRSNIYINGAITQTDSITTPIPGTTRNNGIIAFTYGPTAVEYNGNLDDFRYYKDKALTEAEIYQLYNNNFYNLNISGGFVANGSSVIYEDVGSKAGPNSGTLTLLHGDASGSSSIMFKSNNDPLEYGYIQYEENAPGSTGYHYGLMTIGIENDGGSGSYTSQADRVSLFPSGGQGYVGINTKTPVVALDISGQARIYEGAGTVASSITGSLVLEHTAVGGTSSIMFKGPNTSTGDYAYVQYTDASNVAQSLLKYDFSVNSPATLTGTATIASTGTLTTAIQARPTDNSLAWFDFSNNYPGISLNGTRPNYCISFNQTNLLPANTTRINYLDLSGSLPYSSSFTFSAWINPSIDMSYNTSTSGRYYIANLAQNSPSDRNIFEMFIAQDTVASGNGGKLYALVNGDTSYCQLTSGTMTRGTWAHIAFTFDSLTQRGQMYLNGSTTGIVEASNVLINYSGKVLNTYNTLSLGAQWQNYTAQTPTNNRGFRGQMAFVNFFNVGLSANDISYIYNNPGYNLLSNPERGLMTIGIENETGPINGDRIVLWPGAGTGSVGINTRNPVATLDVSGSVNATGLIQGQRFNSTSDYRVKTDIRDLDASFTVDTLRPVTYKFVSTGVHDIGFIAHEVQETYPFLVQGEKDGIVTQSLNYNGLIGILTKELKELKATVKDLQMTVQDLQATVQDLQSK